MLFPLQRGEGKGSWILHSVLSTKLFEELPYSHSSLGKAETYNWQEEKWHRTSGACNEHVNLATPARDTQWTQERYRAVQVHSEKLTVRSENYWRELVYQSHSKCKGVSFTKDGVLSDSLDISTDSGERDQAVRNCEQTGPPQSFSDSLWAAWEHDRWRLNQWQGQLLLSMGEDTTSVASS